MTEQSVDLHLRAVTMQTEFRDIPLAQLRVSSTPCQAERRKHLDKGAIAELAKSIAGVGVLQPLVVRPIKRAAGLNYLPTDPTHEIVAGERRFLAAREAKLETVPVNVRELTDEQLLEVQLVENLQRDDVHPMAEAEGYEALHKIGRTVDEIADKTGKSRAYVYGRMKLLDLGQAARKAFYEGKLTASTALYVARVPVAGGLQEEAVKAITAPDWSGTVMSARRALEFIQSNYMLRLSDAPFKTGDSNLVPASGACGACPKRTGNQKELFADIKGADVCTDPTCYRAKVAAYTERAIAKSAETGQRGIKGKDVKKIAPYGLRSSLQGFVRLDQRNYDDSKSRTYRQILGKDYVPTLIVDEDKGELIEIAPIADLPKQAKNAASNDSYQAQQKAEQRKRDLDLAYRAELFRRVREASVQRSGALRQVELQEAAVQLFERLSHDEQRALYKARGWEKPKAKGVVPPNYDELPFDIAEISEAELAQLIRDLTLAPDLHTWTHSSRKPESLEDAAAELGIDAKQVRADLVAAAKAKERAKAKPKASPTPKAVKAAKPAKRAKA